MRIILIWDFYVFWEFPGGLLNRLTLKFVYLVKLCL